MVSLVRGFEGGKQVIALEAPKPQGPVVPEIVREAAGPTNMPTVKPTPPTRQENDGNLIRVGSTIFQQYCIVCHGPDGTGSIIRQAMPPIPDFTKAPFQQSRSDSQLKASILDGKGTLMPANRGRVTPEQTDALIAYVRAFGPKGLVVPTGGPISDSEFDKSFQRLQDQWEELQRQLQKSKEKR
jgi:mono/diheme cytochrome c family protein